MQGIGTAWRSRTVGVAAALVACLSLGLLAVGGAGAADSAKRAFNFSCEHDATHVTQTGNRLAARGKLECTGNGVRREVVRVCLLQAGAGRPAVVKCATRARSGTGKVSAVVYRRCGRGPNTGFITRLQIRIKTDDGKVITDHAASSPNRFPRDCTPD